MNCLATHITSCSGRQEKDYCSKHYQQMRRHGEIKTTRRDSRSAIVTDNVVRIPLGLNAKNGYTTVDKEFAHLANDNWGINHFGYVRRSKDKVLLHRLLTGCENGLVVDHKDGNLLDNRLSNLRVCTQAENARNLKLGKNNKTGVKGVSLNGKLYRARLMHNYKAIELGNFKSLSEATKAYNKAATKYFGEFARLSHGV